VIHRFERAIVVHAPLDRVFAELSEPACFLGLQPLLTEIREVDAEPGVRAFQAVERVPILGPIAWRNRLRVELRPHIAEDRVATVAHAPLGIRVEAEFALTRESAATRVRESVVLRCPRWLGGFTVRTAIAAQEALLANLARRLESVPRAGPALG
jgi:hypothetical protein